jgi:pyrimidine oxygenase
MQFTVAEADAIFCGGKDDTELAKTSRQAKAMARDAGRSIRTYTMMNLVIGATDAAAEAMAAHYRAGFDEGALKGMMRAYGFLDSEIGKENAFVANARSSFMASKIIGSATTVARRLSELLEQCALDGVMLIFPEYLEGLRIFAERILPELRKLRSASPATAEAL